MKPIDGRTLSHETSEHIRRMAVRRVREGERPSEVIRSYGLGCSTFAVDVDRRQSIAARVARRRRLDRLTLIEGGGRIKHRRRSHYHYP